MNEVIDTSDYPETSIEVMNETELAFSLNRLNSERANEVGAITVTIADGTVLNGDEVAQGRLARAVSSLTAEETTTWIDVDGLPHTLTQVQLKEALKLAGEAQTAIWVKYATLKAEL